MYAYVLRNDPEDCLLGDKIQNECLPTHVRAIIFFDFFSFEYSGVSIRSVWALQHGRMDVHVLMLKCPLTMAQHQLFSTAWCQHHRLELALDAVELWPGLGWE